MCLPSFTSGKEKLCGPHSARNQTRPSPPNNMNTFCSSHYAQYLVEHDHYTYGRILVAHRASSMMCYSVMNTFRFCCCCCHLLTTSRIQFHCSIKNFKNHAEKFAAIMQSSTTNLIDTKSSTRRSYIVRIAREHEMVHARRNQF